MRIDTDKSASGYDSPANADHEDASGSRPILTCGTLRAVCVGPPGLHPAKGIPHANASVARRRHMPHGATTKSQRPSLQPTKCEMCAVWNFGQIGVTQPPAER